MEKLFSIIETHLYSPFICPYTQKLVANISFVSDDRGVENVLRIDFPKTGCCNLVLAKRSPETPPLKPLLLSFP